MANPASGRVARVLDDAPDDPGCCEPDRDVAETGGPREQCRQVAEDEQRQEDEPCDAPGLETGHEPKIDAEHRCPEARHRPIRGEEHRDRDGDGDAEGDRQVARSGPQQAGIVRGDHAGEPQDHDGRDDRTQARGRQTCTAFCDDGRWRVHHATAFSAPNSPRCSRMNTSSACGG